MQISDSQLRNEKKILQRVEIFFIPLHKSFDNQVIIRVRIFLFLYFPFFDINQWDNYAVNKFGIFQ